MTDRELLEMAAKAADIKVWFPRMSNGQRGVLEPCHTIVNGKTQEWNPLEDDGAAFRLATKLGLVVRVNLRGEYSLAEYFINGEEYEFAIDHNKSSDVNAATRRSIVCAAAEIGTWQKESNNISELKNERF